jgi:hypothetical protein
MQHVAFVMKDGAIYKEDGKAVQFAARTEPSPSIAKGAELLGY